MVQRKNNEGTEIVARFFRVFGPTTACGILAPRNGGTHYASQKRATIGRRSRWENLASKKVRNVRHASTSFPNAPRNWRQEKPISSATKPGTFEATAYRDSQWWTFEIVGLEGPFPRGGDTRIVAMGQARTASQLGEAAREVTALWLDVDESDVEVTVTITNPSSPLL